MMNDFEKLIDSVKPIVKDYYRECGRPKTTRTSNLVLPKTIIEELGPIPDAGHDVDACVEAIKTTFKYSMKTMHPFFNDKLYYGSDPIGQVAELIVAVLNTNSHVYHVSPVFSVME